MSSDTPTDKVNTAVILITSTTAAAILYTFSLLLYILCIRLFYSQARSLDGKIKHRTIYAFIIASAVMACATIDVVCLNLEIRLAYVDNGTLPGGPSGVIILQRTATVQSVDMVVTLVEQILTVGVLSWRVWVVWSGTRFVIPITILSLVLYLAYIGIFLASIILEWRIGSLVLDDPHLEVAARVALATEALAAACLIFMTLMIIIRLMIVRWQHIKLIGKSQVAAQYLDITAMFIESYALNTAWSIGFMTCVAINKAPPTNFFNFSLSQIDALVYFLLLYRVYSGRAWDRQTDGHLSTLRWAGGTQAIGGTTGTASLGAAVIWRESLADPPQYCQLDLDVEVAPTSK